MIDTIAASPLAESGTVLVVEDEPDLAEILGFNLRKHGYAVSIAHDGLTACRRVGEQRPDLILLDVQLPDLDGWEICRMIRGHQEEAIASTPIIMVTALGAVEDRLKGLELGADAYIPKPYSIREILLKSRDLVQERKKLLTLKAQISDLRDGMNRQEEIQGMLFHEMRNQLAVLGGFSHFLIRRHKDLPPAQALAYAEAIRRSCQFLGTLAEELLVARNLRSGQLELPCTLVDPRRAVGETLELYRPLLADAEFCLVEEAIGAVPQIIGNDPAIRLILSILLENALKYGGGGATLTLAVEDSNVVLCLLDQGEGIAPEEAERIFDKFYRGRNVPLRAKGTGLGLFFARTLAEAIGGRLELREAPETGACFAVSLPFGGDPH